MITLGWEDMRAFVGKAKKKTPIIYRQVKLPRTCAIADFGENVSFFSRNASVPVVAHLDHGYTKEECKIALEADLSVMFDGSHDHCHRMSMKPPRSQKWPITREYPARAK